MRVRADELLIMSSDDHERHTVTHTVILEGGDFTPCCVFGLTDQLIFHIFCCTVALGLMTRLPNHMSTGHHNVFGASGHRHFAAEEYWVLKVKFSHHAACWDW